MVYGLWTGEAAACPMCNDIVSRGKDALMAMKFGEGIAWSIVLLFAVPFTMVAALVIVILRANAKKKAHHPENK